MSTKRCILNALMICVFTVVGSTWINAQLLLKESFDIAIGPLDEHAGITSFGFDPDYGAVWDSGIYGSPDVAGGSITPPPSVSGFYNVVPVGNRYFANSGTVIGRAMRLDLNATHFYGSFLTIPSLNSSGADALYNFQNFQFRAVYSESGSFWRMDTFDFFNTGVSAEGTTLVLWELEFAQGNAGLPDTFRIWFNRNPFTDAPDFQDSTRNLGFNNLGSGGPLGFHSNLYLGLSSLEIDEIRIGTNWPSVGVKAPANWTNVRGGR